jgi:hypothetical protein
VPSYANDEYSKPLKLLSDRRLMAKMVMRTRNEFSAALKQMMVI